MISLISLTILFALTTIAFWARAHWLRTERDRIYYDGFDDGRRGANALYGLRPTPEPILAEDTEIDLKWEKDE